MLGNLLKPPATSPKEPPVPPAEPEQPASAEEAPAPAEPRRTAPKKERAKSGTGTPRRARIGRPPGKTTTGEGHKVSLWLNKDLIDEYRDRSWDEHCQLSSLVEKALIHYKKHRGWDKE